MYVLFIRFVGNHKYVYVFLLYVLFIDRFVGNHKYIFSFLITCVLFIDRFVGKHKHRFSFFYYMCGTCTKKIIRKNSLPQADVYKYIECDVRRGGLG